MNRLTRRSKSLPGTRKPRSMNPVASGRKRRHSIHQYVFLDEEPISEAPAPKKPVDAALECLEKILAHELRFVRIDMKEARKFLREYEQYLACFTGREYLEWKEIFLRRDYRIAEHRFFRLKDILVTAMQLKAHHHIDQTMVQMPHAMTRLKILKGELDELKYRKFGGVREPERVLTARKRPATPSKEKDDEKEKEEEAEKSYQKTQAFLKTKHRWIEVQMDLSKKVRVEHELRHQLRKVRKLGFDESQAGVQKYMKAFRGGYQGGFVKFLEDVESGNVVEEGLEQQAATGEGTSEGSVHK